MWICTDAHVLLHAHAHVHVYAHHHVHASCACFTCTPMRMRVCMRMRMRVCALVCLCTRVCVCTCACGRMCMFSRVPSERGPLEWIPVGARARAYTHEHARVQGSARIDQFIFCTVGFVGRFILIDIVTKSDSARVVTAVSCISRSGAGCTDRERLGATLKLFLKAFTLFDSIDGFRNRFDRFNLLLGSIDTRCSCH